MNIKIVLYFKQNMNLLHSLFKFLTYYKLNQLTSQQRPLFAFEIVNFSLQLLLSDIFIIIGLIFLLICWWASLVRRVSRHQTCSCDAIITTVYFCDVTTVTLPICYLKMFLYTVVQCLSMKITNLCAYCLKFY